MKQNKIFPIFIPHLGCPHQCVFCDQHTIAGKQTFDPSLAESELDAMLASRAIHAGGEIAFFGGSFTGIDRALMLRLLTFASRYVSRGVVDGIRLSTRPDYINGEILSILSAFPVTTIELGIQSLSDRVLRASHRGHTASDCLRACMAVKEAGFSLVGQMMTALPTATPEDEVMTARMLSVAGIDAARLYPTVIFPSTPLANLAAEGRYHAPTLEETVSRCADVLEIFLAHDIPVIRIGLCSSSEVRKSGEGFHDAIGALTAGEIYRRRIERALSTLPREGDNNRILVTVAPGHTSLAVGHRKANRLAIEQQYGVRMKVKESEDVEAFYPLVVFENDATTAYT